VLTAGENRVRRIVAMSAVTVACLCLALGGSATVFYGGYFLTVIAALLMTPTAALWLARVLRPVLKTLRPVEGALAADSMIQAPRRTSGAVAALMLSLAQVVGVGGVSRSSYRSIVDWLGTALSPDLFVTGSQNLSDRSLRFPSSVGEEIRRVPGVAEVQMVRSLRITYAGGPVLLIGIQLENVGNRRHANVVAGDARTVYARAGAGEGLIVSENFSSLERVRVGDVLTLNAPGGELKMPVLGIVSDWSDQLGTVFVDRKVFERYWQDPADRSTRSVRGSPTPSGRTAGCS
jgi:putative ABC transport system permease protein